MAVLLQGALYTRSFVMYLTGTKTPATGKTVTINLSKAGGAFSATGSAITEIANGWYKVALSGSDTSTAGDLAFNCTATGCDPTDFADQVGAAPANMVQIDGNATIGNNATLNLKQLNVQNSAGDAAVFFSTGGGGNGMNLSGSGSGSGINTSGSGSGHGLRATGGATGNGIQAGGGATTGNGMFLTTVSGSGLLCNGSGSGAGASFSGSGSSAGILATGGSNGSGIEAAGGGSSGSGLYAHAGGSGVGINAVGVGSVSLLATQGISGPLDAATYNAMADAALVRDWTAVTSVVNTRSTFNALRLLRNKWSISGSTMTVTKEDDATSAWNATLVTDGTALPVVSFTGN